MKFNSIDEKKIKETREFLISYNYWRRGGSTPMPHPKKIGINIETAIEILGQVLNDIEVLKEVK